jgi:hypothetical protein
MHPFFSAASTSVLPPGVGEDVSRQTEDRAYKAVTIAAILLVLGSLWMF